jgi:hypothetical protein
MMKKLIWIIIILVKAANLSSQGFDWQYSSRLPADYPDYYVGPVIDYSYYFHYGSFDFLQDWLPCCTYENGSGSAPKGGVLAEYWKEPYLALNFGIIYDIISANFVKQTQTAETALIWREEYKSESNIYYLTLRPGLKYRVAGSHFNIGAQLNASILLSKSENHYKESLTPERPYSGGEYIYKFNTGKIPSPSKIYIYPSLSAGYDLSIGKGIYLTPYMNFSFPLYSLGDRGEWLPVSISAGFSLLYGLYWH